MQRELVLCSPQLVPYRVPWKDESTLKGIAIAHGLSAKVVGNLRKVLGWIEPAAGRKRTKIADNWQLLEDVGWYSRGEELVPLIGNADHRHMLFNKLT